MNSRNRGCTLAGLAVAALMLSMVAVVNGSASLNISYWASSLPKSAPPPRLRFSPVIDSHDRIFVLDGVVSLGPMQVTNDVYMSADSGASWTCQNCDAAADTKFPPRLSAAVAVHPTDDRIFVGGPFVGGTSGPGNVSDLWTSSDLGLTWTQIVATTAAPSGTAGTAMSMHFSSTGSLYMLSESLWVATSATGYREWTNLGAPTYESRTWAGTLMTSDNRLIVSGGESASTKALADVWSFNVDEPTTGWTQLTAAASWHGRKSQQLCEDSAGTLWAFGPSESASPDAAPELLWSSVSGSERGSVWTLADDSSHCALAWPFDHLPEVGFFSVVCDSKDRMLIIGGGELSHNANPTGDTRTAYVQLGDSASRSAVNAAAGHTSFSTCDSPPSDPSKVTGGPTGLSAGALVGILLAVTSVFTLLCVAWLKWGRKALAREDERRIQARLAITEASDYQPVVMRLPEERKPRQHYTERELGTFSPRI